jgi:L-ribulose-5-phosphate 4-epimerase
MSQFLSMKQNLVDTSRLLVEKGYLMATGGNLSIRIAGTSSFAITPSNYDYTKMTADDICVLDQEMAVIEGHLKPSVESGLHQTIYRHRPDVQAIVHTHQIYASAVSLVKSSIPALFDEQVRFLGKSIDLITYAPSGTSMLKNAIAKKLKDHHNAYIMQNHGVLCFGNTLERAVHNVEIVEKCALTYVLSLCTEKKITKIPLVVQEIAFGKLRSDQKKAANQVISDSGE